MSERVPGSLAVYQRNADYVPRTDGPPVWYRRPEDRVCSTGSNGTPSPTPAPPPPRLQSGEMDWWEQATPDLLPLLRKNPDVTVDVIDTLGYHAVLRFNHLYPPFNNANIRRALLGAFSQTDMMIAVAGDDRSMWKAAVGNFTAEFAVSPATPGWRC